MSKDYYSILGVNKDSTEDDIKKAYRKLAMKYHPDKHKGDKDAENKFKEINEAYEILKDPQKKAAYDRFGNSAFENGGFQNQNSGFDFNGGFGGFNFEDIISEVFGGSRSARARSAVQPGSDMRYDLEISLEEAFSGTTKNIKFRTFCKCDTCKGSGSKDHEGQATCPICHGAGVIRSQQGFFTVEKTCSNCRGTGTVIKNPCKDCSGTGRIFKDKSLDIKIPKGVDNGTKIRLPSEGEAGMMGGETGDLFIFISVKKHKIFKRDGNNLICELPISMVNAALGTEIEVTTLDNQKAELKIPSGTQSGERLKIRGKGMPSLRAASYGDLFVDVSVETPVKLTKKQKELLKEFEEAGKDTDNSPMSSGFFSKLKDFFEKK